MADFKTEYNRLNAEQKQAVDQIDGPLLVLAGPGTGKTQLLSARVANILDKTDTLPQNILCLTFTDSGAGTMRERLSGLIGQAAYDVSISTYHAFGGDLIRRFPEYFTRTRLESPVDELGKREIIASIVEHMSYSNPLKQTQHHLGDLISTISEVKRGLLDEVALKQIARDNAKFIAVASSEISHIFEDFVTMPRKLDAAARYFQKTLPALAAIPETATKNTRYLPLKTIVTAELEKALEVAAAGGKTTPLTTWKNSWLAKDSDNRFILAGSLQNERIEALADVFTQYQAALEARGLYDFDDMILRSINVLTDHPGLKFTLQEQYLYILLDEFQDTNAAQFQLVKLLTDNPVHEQRPTVMAVGDDDQAIYAFQGAHYSNMVDFYHQYRDVTVINLTQNYRSQADILFVAHTIAEQIAARLHHNFAGMSKLLSAANKALPAKADLMRQEFLSDVAEYDWIAENISKKLKQGVNPNEIAVLAPRHKQLEPLVAYLNQRHIPVNYEKRENILDTTTIKALIAMSQLVEALSNQDETTASALWPQVLSYEFWQLPVSDIWRLSWQVSDSGGQTSWTAALLDTPKCKPIVLLFLALAGKFQTETAEMMLDYLIGSAAVLTNEPDHATVSSPLRDYYASTDAQQKTPGLFYEVLSHLHVIRGKLRAYQATRDQPLLLKDFLDFVALYQQSETRMLNSSPYQQAAEAVQLMTVFKAKGREFEYVYLPACIDEVWGESSRGGSNKLTLPANLSPIRHIGATEDERLRIFFVAITRAKQGLYLSSYTHNYAGQPTKRLKYLNEQSTDGSTYQSMALPETSRQSLSSDHNPPQLHTLLSSWQDRHSQSATETSLRGLLQDRLATWQLSPTHLNSFFDLVYAGPEAFFMNTILRFPSAPTPSAQFGNAVHETLQWLQQELTTRGTLPKIKAAIDYFKLRLKSKKLGSLQATLLLERGEVALKAYLAQRGQVYQPGNKPEHSFRSEGVFVGQAHLSGKIDLLEIDQRNKTITVVDYKTGASFTRWSSDAKLHKYRQQLYMYKLLIEGSHSFKGYTVAGGRLEFIEPDSEGKVHSLNLQFTDTELDHTKQLIKAMWQRVTSLDLPNVSAYATTAAASKQFEQDLIAGKI